MVLIVYINRFFFLLKERLTGKQFLLVSSILVGLSAGISAVILKLFAHYIFDFVNDKGKTYSSYFYLILPLFGIALTALIIKIVLKGKINKGVGSLMYLIRNKSSRIPKEQMYDQIITSSLTVGFGGSAGLEAPIVLTGAAFGSNYASTFKLNQNDRTLLLACGVAGGIGAAFNAPIAGVLFALEVLLLDIGITAFIPLILSAATGALISKIILHTDILLSISKINPFNYKYVLFYLILGVFSGLISVYHIRVFSKVEGFIKNAKINFYLKIVLGGLFLSTLILMFPSLYGEGFESIRSISSSDFFQITDKSILANWISSDYLFLLFIALIIFIKPIATGVTLGSGGNGGNFAPSLFVGAFVGLFTSKFFALLFHIDLPMSNFILVGMAGILSGLYHAPLTAIFLIAEITGGYSLMIPLMIVSSISFAISKYFEPLSMDNRISGKADDLYSNKDLSILLSLRIDRLIEKDYPSIQEYQTIDELIELLRFSSKNLITVTDAKEVFKGYITIDTVKEYIFDKTNYSALSISKLTEKAKVVVYADESVDALMQKFDNHNIWLIPVLDHEKKLLGYISKSKLLNEYRNIMLSSIIE